MTASPTASQFKLTRDNYHSPEAVQRYLSASAIKTARRCENRWWAERNGLYIQDDTSSLVAGRLFESVVCDELEAIPAECISTRGATKGELKAEYRNVISCADAIKNQPMLYDIIQRSQKQVIMTGTLFGAPVRVMTDLIDTDGSIYDLKLMRDFLPIWDDNEERYVEWWQYWYYHIQMYIYREIAKQNGLNPPRVGLIAASRSNADIQAITFKDDTLLTAQSDTQYTINRMLDIINGMEQPVKCGNCPYCIETKKIDRFMEV